MNLAKAATVLSVTLGVVLLTAGCGNDADSQPTVSRTSGTTSSVRPSPTRSESPGGSVFIGDVEGIWVGPGDFPVPPEFTTYEDVCGDIIVGSAALLEDAGALNLLVELPPEYELQVDSLNTGAVACGETIYTARREYHNDTDVSTGQGAATLLLGRALFTYHEAEMPPGRIKTIELGGRRALFIEPDDYSSFPGGSIVFWEQFGQTFIYGVFLPREKLLEVGRLVAEATRPQ